MFRESGRGGEREGNITVWLPLMHRLLRTWPATQACAVTGNRTCEPVVRRLAPNPLSHTSWAFLFCILTLQGGMCRSLEVLWVRGLRPWLL